MDSRPNRRWLPNRRADPGRPAGDSGVDLPVLRAVRGRVPEAAVAQHGGDALVNRYHRWEK